MAQKQYSGSNFQFSMLGESPFEGVVSLSYSVTKERTAVYTIGSDKPTSYREGNKVFEGSITLTMSAYARLISAIPEGSSLVDFELFDIVVLGLGTNLTTIQENLKATFTSAGVEITAEDGSQAVEIGLYIHDIS